MTSDASKNIGPLMSATLVYLMRKLPFGTKLSNEAADEVSEIIIEASNLVLNEATQIVMLSKIDDTLRKYSLIRGI